MKTGLPSQGPFLVGSLAHPALDTCRGTANVRRMWRSLPLLPSLQSSPRSPKALSKLPLPAPSLAEDPDSHPFSQQRQSPSSRHLNPHSHRQPQARSSGCQDQWQSTLLPERRQPAGPPPFSRPCEACSTWQGTVSKFLSASPPRERHPGSSQ